MPPNKTKMCPFSCLICREFSCFHASHSIPVVMCGAYGLATPHRDDSSSYRPVGAATKHVIIIIVVLLSVITIIVLWEGSERTPEMCSIHQCGLITWAIIWHRLRAIHCLELYVAVTIGVQVLKLFAQTLSSTENSLIYTNTGSISLFHISPMLMNLCIPLNLFPPFLLSPSLPPLSCADFAN